MPDALDLLLGKLRRLYATRPECFRGLVYASTLAPAGRGSGEWPMATALGGRVVRLHQWHVPD